MSRNFELMRQAGKGIGQRKGSRIEVDADATSVTQLGTGVPELDDNKAFDWARTLGILRKHWRMSALFAAIVLLTVIGINVFTRPVYEAIARVEIDPSGEKFSLENNGAGAIDAEYLETQSQIMQGDSLAIAVIRKLRLDQNPAVVGKMDADALKTANLKSSDAQQLTPEESFALGKFKDDLKVKRDTASRLILVSFTSPDPQLAAQVSNSLVQTFIDQSFQSRHDAVMKSSEWLSRQLDDIRKKMEDSTQALTQFQQSTGVADVDANKSTFTEHMGELSRQQTQAQSERIQIQALLKNTDNPDSLTEVRSNIVVQQLSQKLAEQKAALSQAMVVYGSNHPTARKLQSEVDELQSQLGGQKKAIVNSLRASYAAAAARETLMAAEMKGTSKELDKVARYSTLKKEVEANVELYNSLYGKIKEAGISAASKSVDIQVVDPARVPDDPIRPRRMINLAVGLLAALFGGIGLAFVCEEFDNKLRSPEDIRRWIGSANVSIIPVISESESPATSLGWSKKIVGSLPARPEDNKTNMFFLERPNSPESEAVQALYASIMLSWPNNPPQTLLIVSAFPGEGKTTVALNLSYALAQHANTCLVDADLRKGRVASAFSLPAGQGLGDVLSGDATLESSLLEVPGMNNLSILPAGRSKGNFGQLVCSERMEQTLSGLRERFRFVVVDSAPILPFVDGRALSTLADAVILVGRSGITTRQAMRRSVELISEVHGAPILQVVLNAANMESTDYKYYRYGYEDSVSTVK
ncbi:MAG TPA: polysaccharide biosynthesis tyrosine autokinase [Terriglobales bacterium]|nr:polysaccharide biosynthesis tyrosine autokinase [Terriglobales bacterium]